MLLQDSITVQVKANGSTDPPTVIADARQFELVSISRHRQRSKSRPTPVGFLALEKDLYLLRDLAPERLAELASIPVGKQGRAISGDDNDTLLVGTNLTRGVDQRFAEEQGGAGRGHDLVDQAAVLVRHFDKSLGRHVDLVAARDHYGASVIGTEVSQVRERFNEVAVKKTVVRVAHTFLVRNFAFLAALSCCSSEVTKSSAFH